MRVNRKEPNRPLAGALSPLIAVDRSDARPLHRQIYQAFRSAILEHALAPGQQVPSTRALAQELGVSRLPVLEAYAQLIAEGYFETRQSAATFVSNALASKPEASDARATSAAVAETRPRRAQELRVPKDRPACMRGSGAFSLGTLDFQDFPFSVWSRLVARHARLAPASVFAYGDALGSVELRRALAGYLRATRAVHCDPDQILIVNGSQQALDLCARVLLDPGSPVWIEEPGYWLARYALASSGNLVPVPVDSAGIDVAAGLQLCPNPRAIYVSPSHQFPLGFTMSVARRLELLKAAHQCGAWIIEDDYDSEYRFDSSPLSSLQGLDTEARVIYIGTFSKSLFPGLRLGYLVLPPDLVDDFRATRVAMDICPPQFHQSALAEFIEEGHFARHVRRTRARYAERRSELASALDAELGGSVLQKGSQAGMHLTIEVPHLASDIAVSNAAADERLWLFPLSRTYMNPNPPQGFILGFGCVRTEEIRCAVQTLAALLASKA